jgi:hypothetical protein
MLEFLLQKPGWENLRVLTNEDLAAQIATFFTVFLRASAYLAAFLVIIGLRTVSKVIKRQASRFERLRTPSSIRCCTYGTKHHKQLRGQR